MHINKDLVAQQALLEKNRIMEVSCMRQQTLQNAWRFFITTIYKLYTKWPYNNNTCNKHRL